MSGKHAELPYADHPLGYTEPQVRQFLGYRWPGFKAWLRQELVSWDADGQVRYWPGNIHGFLHQGDLFEKEEPLSD